MILNSEMYINRAHVVTSYATIAARNMPQSRYATIAARNRLRYIYTEPHTCYVRVPAAKTQIIRGGPHDSSVHRHCTSTRWVQSSTYYAYTHYKVSSGVRGNGVTVEKVPCFFCKIIYLVLNIAFH